ncbi:MAG: DUF2027 domain-containing protein [Prevotella sp.]
MKIGDKVRFLNDVGGGRVAGFSGSNIVLVEDEDGFQIPTSIADVVVIDEEDYGTGKMVAHSVFSETKTAKEKADQHKHLSDVDEDYDPADREITFRVPVEERKGGNLLNCYLAFVPLDFKSLTTTGFESYIVNDSNYYLHVAYYIAENANWFLKYSAEIEPNTKCFIEEIDRESLNSLGKTAIQLLAYKRDRAFVIKSPVDVQLRIEPIKFFKLHTFEENDFFEAPALLYPIVENDRPARSLTIDADAIKRQMYSKDVSSQSQGQKNGAPQRDSYVRRYESGKHHPAFRRRETDKDAVIVDLHAHELLDTTAGMSNADILNYQVDVFRKTMDAHIKEKGKRIIFIHGKGEGVLRQALIHELKYRYKSCTYQDASFLEYGFGATQVTVK